MRRVPVLFGVVALGLALLVGVGATEDAKKEEKKEEKKIVGLVPTGWSKALKLTKDQSAKIKMIDVEYKTKIAELDKKVQELKLQSRIEMTKQLNDEQKAILAKLSGLDGKEKEKEKEKEKK